MTAKEPIAPSEQKINAMAGCDTSAALSADAPEITMSDVGKLARAYLHLARQNAAESLPAQPVQECEHCGQPKNDGGSHGHKQGYGDFESIGCSWPDKPMVAPVDAKEKPSNEREEAYSALEDTSVLRGNDVSDVVMSPNLYATNATNIEEKAASSEPDLEKTCRDLHQDWEAGTSGFTNQELEMAEIGFRGGFKAALTLKPQPDSSSISTAPEPKITDEQMCKLSLYFNRFASKSISPNDEHLINKWLKWNIERIRQHQPSSISTAPVVLHQEKRLTQVFACGKAFEQETPKLLVSDEMVAHLTNDDVNSVADMATELQQWRKWAAKVEGETL